MPTKSTEIPNTEITSPRPAETALPKGVEVTDFAEADVTQTSVDWLGNRAIGNIASGISYAGEIPEPAPTEARQVPSENFQNFPA